MDLSVSAPPPSCSEGVCPPKQKTKTLMFFEILVPVPPPSHRDSHSKRREVSVNSSTAMWCNCRKIPQRTGRQWRRPKGTSESVSSWFS